MSVRRARALRQDMTDAERRLWRALRAHRFRDWHFRRQHPVGHFVVDFACLPASLVIELDGGQHTPERDAPRTARIEAAGFRVLRFWNDEVLRNLDGVLAAITAALEGHGEGVP
jgi:very-short-patch-repair endonuclease